MPPSFASCRGLARHLAAMAHSSVPAPHQARLAGTADSPATSEHNGCQTGAYALDGQEQGNGVSHGPAG